MVLSGSDEAEPAERRAAIIVAEKDSARTARNPDGYRGPEGTVVWEPGGETLRATRLAGPISTHDSCGRPNTKIQHQSPETEELLRRKELSL